MSNMPLEPLSEYSLSSAGTSWGRKFSIYYQKTILSHLIPSLTEGASILEIGTGRGEFADEVVKRGFNYTGVEPSRQMRDDLIKRKYKILSQPIPDIELPDNSVDLVHSSQVVEHLSSYIEVMKFLSESYRVLRPGGYVSVVAPNYDTLGSMFFRYEYQHTYITNQDRLEGLIKDTGFKVIRSIPFLTPVGLRKFRLIERMAVHMIFPFVRNTLLYSAARKLVGRDIVFRCHKNFGDSVGVIGRKPFKDISG